MIDTSIRATAPAGTGGVRFVAGGMHEYYLEIVGKDEGEVAERADRVIHAAQQIKRAAELHTTSGVPR